MYFENNLLITAQDMQNCFMSKIISCFSAVFDVKGFSKIIREEHFVTLSYNIHVPNQCMNPMWCDYFISYFVNDECFFCNQILSSFESVFYQKKGWVIYFYDFSVPWGSFFQTHCLNHQHLFFSFVQTETWEQPDIFLNDRVSPSATSASHNDHLDTFSLLDELEFQHYPRVYLVLSAGRYSLVGRQDIFLARLSCYLVCRISNSHTNDADKIHKSS